MKDDMVISAQEAEKRINYEDIIGAKAKAFDELASFYKSGNTIPVDRVLIKLSALSEDTVKIIKEQ